MRERSQKHIEVVRLEQLRVIEAPSGLTESYKKACVRIYNGLETKIGRTISTVPDSLIWFLHLN